MQGDTGGCVLISPTLGSPGAAAAAAAGGGPVFHNTWFQEGLLQLTLTASNISDNHALRGGARWV